MPTNDDSTSYLSAVLRTVVDGIITIDEAGTITTVNPATERIFGYTADEMVGHDVRMLMPDHYAREHAGYLRNYHETGIAKVIGVGREVEGMRKDGSVFPLELAVSEIPDERERSFVGIVRDVTERHRNERVKREFISTISHELRTPLTSIQGAVEIVLDDLSTGLDERARRLLENAQRNGERLRSLVEQILDLERHDVGRLSITPSLIDLTEVARQACHANEGYAAIYGVELRADVPAEPAPILGDAERLGQVFGNLISNAVKHSPPGGTVLVRVRAGQEHHRATVHDDGPGVPADLHARIFDRFVQADSSDTRARGGTGLGLSIARALVELHQGVLDIAPTESGAEFYVELPAASRSTNSRSSSGGTARL